jgi:hypothetical protein
MTAPRGPRPGRPGAWRWAVLGGLLAGTGAAVLWTSGCAGALFTAPPGSSILAQANPEFIAAFGATSTITAVVVEPTGTYVPDGTVVQFFTNLGTIDREARTRNGVARANLVSDSRSGTATVTVVSGGDAPVPVPSASPTTTPSPSPSTRLPAALGAAALGASGVVTAAGAVAASQAAATVNVTIGNPNVQTIQLRAVPPRITISNSTHVIATVLGADGNPIANVPVSFFADSTPATDDLDPSFEFMDSAGRPLFTNQNGEVEDVMRTRRTTTGEARVRAVVAGGGRFVTADVRIPIL